MDQDQKTISRDKVMASRARRDAANLAHNAANTKIGTAVTITHRQPEPSAHKATLPGRGRGGGGGRKGRGPVPETDWSINGPYGSNTDPYGPGAVK